MKKLLYSIQRIVIIFYLVQVLFGQNQKKKKKKQPKSRSAHGVFAARC